MDHEAMDILREGGREGTGKEFRRYLKRTGVSGAGTAFDHGGWSAYLMCRLEYDLWEEPDFSVDRDHGSLGQDVGNARGDCLCAI